MDAGINQLVDTYKGNPAPLQQQVQRDQKQQPQAELSPDLEEAIALQKIAELQNSARNQQAIQTGGAQPTIIDKLRQMLGGNRPQAQMAQANTQGQPPMPMRPMMPQQPVRAATGGSIAQLASNLGRHYAGGGIIAFNSRGSVKDPDKQSDAPDYRIPELQKSDLYAKALAAAQGDKPEPSNEDIKKALAFVSAPAAAGLDVLLSPLKFLANNSFRSPLSNAPLANYTTAMDARNKYLYGEKPAEEAPAAAAAPEDMGREGRRTGPVAVGVNPNANPNLVPASARPQPEAPAAPKPPAAPQAEAPQKVDPNSLRAMAEKYIRDEMGLKPETERDKAVEWSRKTMGLDDLLAEKSRRADAREQAIAEVKANRTPEWIRGLQAAGGAPVRGGIGMLLGKVGSEMSNTREAYANQDLAYQAELDRLRDVITDAKISGNKELAKEGMAAYKEVDARRKAALTSVTSLLNTDELSATRRQMAKDAAAARIAAMGNRGELAADKQQLAELKALQSAVTSQLKNAYGTERKTLQAQLATINAEIAKMAGMSTMGAAPGAGSPGGIPPDIQALMKKYGGK